MQLTCIAHIYIQEIFRCKIKFQTRFFNSEIQLAHETNKRHIKTALSISLCVCVCVRMFAWLYETAGHLTKGL